MMIVKCNGIQIDSDERQQEAIAKYINLIIKFDCYILYVKMGDEKIFIPTQLPIPQKNRVCTDIFCTIIGAAFALTLFIVACVTWNKDNFQKRFFALQNGAGDPCAEDNVLFIADYTNLTKNTCVKSCPTDYYPTERICLPQGSVQLQQYLQNPDIAGPLQHIHFIQTLLWSSLIAFSLGLGWLTVVQCLPRIAPILAHLLSVASLIALGVVILVIKDQYWSGNFVIKIVIAVICFVLALISIVMLCLYSNAVKFQGLFLHYASRFLAKHLSNAVYLILHLILLAGLIVLFIWQYSCYSSINSENRNYFNFCNGGIWQIFNILQFIWGVQFLRDSYNFCVSGAAADYYWKQENKQSCYAPFSRLICSHWGSVVGGSFLNAFFELPTLLVQLLTCHPTACLGKLGVCCNDSCKFLTCLFDLVRTDAYSYINFGGLPFCNSARECAKICSQSKHFVGRYSPIKHYRFVSHLFLVSTSFIVAWLLLRSKLWVYGFWQITILVVISYVVVTGFIDLHANSAQGLQTSYLAEHSLEPNHSLLQRLHPDYRADLEQWERRKESDGNF